MKNPVTKKRIVVLVAVIGLLVVGLGATFAATTWGNINRVTIDRPVEAVPGPVAREDPEVEEEEPAPLPDDTTEIYLLVGSDARDDLDDLEGFGFFEGRRADVVMLLIKTPTGTALMSLPRDLWVSEACIGAENRLNALLEGCPGLMNGPTLLVLAVEDLIGESVDHYAMIDLAGFQQVVDEIGGYEICVNREVRDALSNLALPAGCTQASGAQALAWLRSRHTQELTSDGWRALPGMNDLARNERQRGFLIDMMARLADFTSPQALTSMARTIAPHVTVDDELTLGDAVDLAWAFRDLDRGQVTELQLPVVDYVTEDGAAVLLPVTPVDEIVGAYLQSRSTAGLEGVFGG